MRKRSCYRPSLSNFLIGSCIFAAVSITAVDKARNYAIYTKAKNVAEKRIGDCKAPLDDLERKEWYSEIGISQGSKLDTYQLQNYINRYGLRTE